jgi:hypothetical protein
MARKKRRVEVLSRGPPAVSFVEQGPRPVTKTKNENLQKVLDVITNFVEGQLSKLPPEIAEVKRKEINQIVSTATQPARKKRSKPSGTRAKRPSSRSRA